MAYRRTDLDGRAAFARNSDHQYVFRGECFDAIRG